MAKTVQKAQELPLIRSSAHQIWLAGLGALSVAEDESGKLFKTLVKRGKSFELTAKDRVDEMRGKLDQQFDEMKERFDVRKAASATMDRMGDGFDESMTQMLHRLGLPTKREIEGLSKRVERLTKTLEEKPARAMSRRRGKRRIAATST